MAENSPEDIEKMLAAFKEWVGAQSQLPKDLDDTLLRRFLHSCYYDMEKTKTCIELFFSIRASSPDLITNRDPNSPQMQKALGIVNLARIESGEKNIWIWQLNDPGLDRFDYVQDVKVMFLSTDAWLLSDDRLEESDYVIIDVKDVSLKFLTKYNVSVAKRLTKYQQEAIPIRLKQIHLVNAPPFIDKIFALLKPFLKQEITQLIHFHPPKTETLHKFFTKDELPQDYGGNRENMDAQMKIVMELVTSLRDRFADDDFWKTTDKKSKKTDTSTEIGSFRTLAID